MKILWMNLPVECERAQLGLCSKTRKYKKPNCYILWRNLLDANFKCEPPQRRFELHWIQSVVCCDTRASQLRTKSSRRKIRKKTTHRASVRTERMAHGQHDARDCVWCCFFSYDLRERERVRERSARNRLRRGWASAKTLHANDGEKPWENPHVSEFVNVSDVLCDARGLCMLSHIDASSVVVVECLYGNSGFVWQIE